MYNLSLPTIVMLALAVGSTVLVIDRMLEGKREVASTVFVTEPSSAPSPAPSNKSDTPQSNKPLDTAANANPAQTAPTYLSVLRSSASRSLKQQHASRPLVISIQDGRLSIRAKAVPLEALLSAISNKSGVPITYDALSARLITAAFDNVPLDEVVKKILTEQDVFLSYAAGAAQHALTGVWVYPKGQGRAIELAPPEAWAATAEFEQDLSTSSDWGTRARAIEQVIERKGSDSRDDVLYALNDPNPNVRFSALSGALSISLRLPQGTLEKLMLYDPSAYVRALALKAIAEDPRSDKLTVRSMAQAALNDPDSGVQEQARDVLNTLKQNEANNIS
jgi:hypothetical protein